MPAQRRQLLGSGKVAEVFALGDKALKLYRDGTAKSAAFREAAILSLIEASGLPVPRVETVAEFDGRWGVLMSRVEGTPFAPALLLSPPSRDHLDALAALHARIHRHSVPQLPSLKGRLAANIEGAPQLDATRRRRLLSQLAALPDGDRVCHGDFHPWNVLGTPGDATVIDWLDASTGEPAADLCRSYVLISHASMEMAQSYVEAYASLSGLAMHEVWRWRAVVAGARLAEGVPDEEPALLAMVDAA